MNCLLIIDVQIGFIKNNHRIVKKIEKLLYDNNFNKIVFTKFINKENSIFIKQLNWCKMQNEFEQTIPLNVNNYKVIKKEGYSALTIELINYIRENKIDTVYLCGFDTDACILKTALDIFEIGLTPKVLKDFCMSSGGRKYHKSALEILKRNIGQKNII